MKSEGNDRDQLVFGNFFAVEDHCEVSSGTKLSLVKVSES
jgi:hypothetical protein